MSTPTIPANDPIQETIPGVFEENKVKIVGGIVAVLAVIVIGGAVQLSLQKKQEALESEFAMAKTSAAYSALIDKAPKDTIAGNARLLLAEEQRGEEKYAEAISTLEGFLADNRNHPLTGVAMLSLAGTYQQKGDDAQALQTYRQIPAQLSGSFAAPLAMLAEAALLAKSNPDDARKVLENIIVQFPDEAAAQQASMDLRLLPAATETEAPQEAEQTSAEEATSAE